MATLNARSAGPSGKPKYCPLRMSSTDEAQLFSSFFCDSGEFIEFPPLPVHTATGTAFLVMTVADTRIVTKPP